MLSSVFFDAGNTLVLADNSKTLAPLLAAGFQPSQEQLYAAERFAKKRLDALMAARQPGESVDGGYWDMYYTHLIRQLNAPAELIAPSIASTRRAESWCRLAPGAREVLLELRRRGLHLGVISNSDGHIEDALRGAGIGDCFDSFTDSGNVGVEKPDPRIFQIALASLGATPEESIFAGDTYSVDYQGAWAAGMGAILVDPAGVYRDDEYPRAETLAELLTML